MSMATKTNAYIGLQPLIFQGSGIVDGEILESLWSLLNRISRSCRGMTTAHRAEVIDDHMGDSNWKKTINMGLFYFGFKVIPMLMI